MLAWLAKNSAGGGAAGGVALPPAALKRAQEEQRRADGLAYITRKLGIPAARGAGRPSAARRHRRGVQDCGLGGRFFLHRLSLILSQGF